MGIFDDEAERLLRNPWTGEDGATNLAQELYSIFTSKGPIQISSPVQIATNSQDPSLSIVNNFGDSSGPALNINGGTVQNGDIVYGGSAYTYDPTFNGGQGGLTQVYFPANGDPQFNFTDLGDFLASFGWDPLEPADAGMGQGPASAPGAFAPGGGDGPSPGTGPVGGGGKGSSGSGLVGIVKSGSGGTYQVGLYLKGFGFEEGPTVTVSVPNILGSEQIPAGTRIVGIIGCDTQQAQVNNNPTVVYYYQPPVWM